MYDKTNIATRAFGKPTKYPPGIIHPCRTDKKDNYARNILSNIFNRSLLLYTECVIKSFRRKKLNKSFINVKEKLFWSFQITLNSSIQSRTLKNKIYSKCIRSETLIPFVAANNILFPTNVSKEFQK